MLGPAIKAVCIGQGLLANLGWFTLAMGTIGGTIVTVFATKKRHLIGELDD